MMSGRPSSSVRGRVLASIEASRDAVRKRTRRRVEAVLNKRAEGQSVARISTSLDVGRAEVEAILERARAGQDARALTDRQAVGRAAEVTTQRLAKLARTVAAKADAAGVEAPIAQVEAVAPASGAGLRVIRRPTFRAGEGAERAAYVGRLRHLGEWNLSLKPQAAAGLLHLADLFEHCPTSYPAIVMKSEGYATLESTERAFPQLGRASACFSSPAALCVGA